MDDFDEFTFRLQVEEALEKARTLLDNTRVLQYPADVHHAYDDKYVLAEFLTNSTIATLQRSLELIGVNEKILGQLREWAQKKSVTVRFSCEEKCKYLRETSRDVQSATSVVTKSMFGKSESYTVTKVTEHFWSFTATWEISAFVGVEFEKRIVLQSRTGSVEIKTASKTAPRPESLIRQPIDANITWLLQHIDENSTPAFHINRTAQECKTPRRNPEVEACLTFLEAFQSWAYKVEFHIRTGLFSAQHDHGLALATINSEGIFVPVVPVFEKPQESPSSPSALIPPVIFSAFLGEHARSLDAKFNDLSKTFPADTKLITLVEAKLCVILMNIKQVYVAYLVGVDSIEKMLYNQLVAAIGKKVTPSDFSNYLTFHNRKIFKEQFRPQPFCYSIRRPGYTPEGTLSIESESNPIATIANYNFATRPMKFPINASATISFFGDRYLHGYVAHQFEGVSNQLSLCARARQFSSFILLVGRIVSADIFDPKHAIIIQNKDDLKIPLMLETIPTPKEFKDAIASLSPEQQQFCKAYRSMQLESTLFGVCIIQIKPQLEKLLKLPEDSLTKEIQLTQDLLKLFIMYQIPSDLLSYDGPQTADSSSQISTVKEYVRRMHTMLDKEKHAELQEAVMQQQMRVAQQSVPQQPRHTAQHIAEKEQDEMLDKILAGVNRLKSMAANINMELDEQNSMLDSLDESVDAKPRKSTYKKTIDHEESRRKREETGHRIGKAKKESAINGKRSALGRGAPIPPAADGVVTTRETNVQQQPQSLQQQPQQSQQQQVQQQPLKQLQNEEMEDESSVVDYTKIPSILEQNFEAFDSSNALRPTIINPGSNWELNFQKSLLSKPEKKTLLFYEHEQEKWKAFDLLDALTKSGALSIDHASLHVVIASTHCFEKSLMRTIIQDNINPIEKVENSSIIVASTVHQTTPSNLIAAEHLSQVTAVSPLLLQM